MKNFWTESTVNRNADRAGFPNPEAYLTAKEKEFERDSGVKWSASHGGGGYTFHPVDEGIPVANSVSPEDLELIRYAYKKMVAEFPYVTYLAIHEKTGISLKRLMSIVKWMEKNGQARRTVNRMGKVHAFKLL